MEEIITLAINQTEQVCVNCKHYMQHYVFNGTNYTMCNAGHCVYPRLKNRTPFCSCNKFENR